MRTMVPSKALTDSVAQLVAENPDFFDADDSNFLWLIKAPFTPSPTLQVEDVEFADFESSDPIAPQAGPSLFASDPTTGRQIVQLLDQGAGFHWITVNTVNLPQVIYGVMLVSPDQLTCYGSALLEEPITLTEANQIIDLGSVRFTLAANPLG